MQYSSFWIIVKGSYQNSKVEGRRRDSWRRLSTFSCRQKEGDKKKYRVVAVTHGDDYQLFSCRQKERDKKKYRVVAVTHGDNLKNCCHKITRNFFKGCCLESRRQSSNLMF